MALPGNGKGTGHAADAAADDLGVDVREQGAEGNHQRRHGQQSPPVLGAQTQYGQTRGQPESPATTRHAWRILPAHGVGGGGFGEAVAIDGEEQYSLMINEEDHLRMQALRPGLQLMEAWQAINDVDVFRGTFGALRDLLRASRSDTLEIHRLLERAAAAQGLGQGHARIERQPAQFPGYEQVMVEKISGRGKASAESTPTESGAS